MALRGYDHNGHDSSGNRLQNPDPVLSHLYEPIADGKIFAMKVAENFQERGFPFITVYNLIEVMTDSSQMFPEFSIFVFDKMYQGLWSNEDAKKNPFWERFMSYVHKHYGIEALSKKSSEIVGHDHLAEIWDPSKVAQYGARTQAHRDFINKNLSELDRMQIDWLARVFSHHATVASAERMKARMDSGEDKGEATVFLGYPDLSRTAAEPLEKPEERQFVTVPPLPYERAQGKPNTKEKVFSKRLGQNGETYYQVLEGQEGHMTIVRGMDQFMLAIRETLGDKALTGFSWKGNFKETLRVNAQVKIFKTGTPEEPKLELVDVRSGQVYAVFEGKPPAGEKTRWKSKTPMKSVKAPEKKIPHHGDLNFVKELQVFDEGTTAFTGSISIPENGTLADLCDGAAQLACGVLKSQGRLTIFRSFKGLEVSLSAIEQMKKGFKGEFEVIGFVQENEKKGMSKFLSVKIFDKNDNLLVLGSEMSCVLT